ncbi:pseudopaline exporter CntI-like [Ptychodera flava]|uniref:pseudopaline exporter CntI-like n=1 Tax=Ptychodera flava TaxID=63121 RepID=UPI003969F8AB
MAVVRDGDRQQFGHSESDRLCNSTQNGNASNLRQWIKANEDQMTTDCLKSLVGAVLATLSGVFMGVCNIFILLGFHGGLSPSQQVTIRSVVLALVTSLAIIGHSIDKDTLSRRDIMLNIVKGVISNACDIAFYYSMNLIGMGDASALLVSTQPIFATLIACIYLRERCNRTDVMTVIINTVGTLLITRPNFIFGSASWKQTDHQSLGYILAIGVGAAFAWGTILVKLMSERFPVSVITWFDGVMGLIMGIPASYFTSKGTLYEALKQNHENIGYVAGMATLYTLYFWAYNRATQLEDVAKVVLLFNVTIIVGYLGDFLLFDKAIGWTSIVGTILIILNSLFVYINVCYRQTDHKEVQSETYE